MQIPAELLSLTDEAVVLLRGSRISFANRAAQELLGQNCLGMSLTEFFGAELGVVQSGSFTASINVNGQSCILNTAVFDGVRAMTLVRATDDSMNISQAIYASINNTLMNTALALSNGADIAAERKDAAFSRCINSFRRDYYKLKRLSSNAQYAENIMQNQLPFHPELSDLSRLVESYIETLRSMFPKKEFKLSMPDELILGFDRQLIVCALGNLLDNTLSHAEASSIAVSITDTQNSVFISVSDNGHGISQNRLSEVFCKYRHFSAPGDGHAGIGLTVVRGIAHTHGGTLLIESREKTGTVARMSVSKKLMQTGKFHTGASTVTAVDINDVLTAVADNLPDDVFI